MKSIDNASLHLHRVVSVTHELSNNLGDSSSPDGYQAYRITLHFADGSEFHVVAFSDGARLTPIDSAPQACEPFRPEDLGSQDESPIKTCPFPNEDMECTNQHLCRTLERCQRHAIEHKESGS